ncbi:unnamed protein product [Caenorhabditis auriculariae]|uniref:Uncharacterized protein n=1 Tax=Caenorhabditis auriculariae TaxID=2777116 RepID=A0A8S1HWZ4_9PELO|nr:unnamed protein product [Caenorhabditis auriculariae]
MLQLIAYFVLNVIGFLFFLSVWRILPKPKPLDYTTIPGLKLDVAEAEEIPPMVVGPGEEVDYEFRGHWDKIKKFPSLRLFLEYLELKFGPLNSFYWSNRFVVSVCNLELVQELRKHEKHLLAISPLAFCQLFACRSRNMYCGPL